MRNDNKLWIIIVILLGCMYSCEKQDLFIYDQTPRINFYSMYNDYVFRDTHYLYNYESVLYPIDVELQGSVPTVNKKFCIICDHTTDYEKKATVTCAESYIYVGAVNENLNRNMMTIEVEIKRPEKPTGKEPFKEDLIFDIDNPLHEFDRGCENKSRSYLEVSYVIKPGDWDENWWGKYCDGKYFFMMDYFKKVHKDIKQDETSLKKLKEAYLAYRVENPPIVDEKGVEIVFPNK